jgi:hypothetical protein
MCCFYSKFLPQNYRYVFFVKLFLLLHIYFFLVLIYGLLGKFYNRREKSKKSLRRVYAVPVVIFVSLCEIFCHRFTVKLYNKIFLAKAYLIYFTHFFPITSFSNFFKNQIFKPALCPLLSLSRCEKPKIKNANLSVSMYNILRFYIFLYRRCGFLFYTWYATSVCIT